MRSKDTIVLAWCDPGQVDGMFAYDLVGLYRARGQRMHPVTIRAHGGGLLSRTRNEVVKTFLDATDGAWLWMVDTDHRLPLASFDLLCDAAHDVSHPVVGGMYFGASRTHDGPYPRPVPIAYDLDDGSFMPIPDVDPPRLRRVDGVGTGSLLVHRGVLTAIRDAADDGLRDWCWFADGPIGDGRWLSEDLMFCARVTAAGFPIHVHTGAVFPHHKTFWQDDDTWRLWRRADGGQQR